MTDKKKPPADIDAANLPTFDEIQEMAAEAEEPAIDEPARDIVTKQAGNVTKSPYKVKFTVGGEPLPIDPNTGGVDFDILTKNQRQRMQDMIGKTFNKLFEDKIRPTAEAFNKIAADLPNETAGNIRDWLQDVKNNLQPLQSLYDEIDQLEPYLRKELEKPEYEGRTFDDMLHSYTLPELLELRTNPDSYLFAAFEAAKRSAEKELQQPGGLPAVYYNKSTSIETSTDKLATLFFSVVAPPGRGTIPGQISMGIDPTPEEMIPLKYEKSGAKKEITLFYDYSYDDDVLRATGLDKRFDAQDFFIMSICDNLFLNDNKEVSLTKIYKELTGKEPNDDRLEELADRLKRGLSTTLALNDKEVREAWGTDDKYGEIFSPVMPLQLLNERFIANGTIARSKVIINGLSPMHALSRSIGHVSTWDKEVLTEYTGRRTPRYWRVLHYLMAQIGWLRAPGSNRSNKITYADLYKDTDAKTRREKQATRDMFYRLLDEVFIKLDYIKSYKETTRGEPGVILKYTKHGQRVIE